MATVQRRDIYYWVFRLTSIRWTLHINHLYLICVGHGIFRTPLLFIGPIIPIHTANPCPQNHIVSQGIRINQLLINNTQRAGQGLIIQSYCQIIIVIPVVLPTGRACMAHATKTPRLRISAFPRINMQIRIRNQREKMPTANSTRRPKMSKKR